MSSSQVTATTEPVVLRVGGVPEHFNLPWRLAVESGEFEALGIRVEWTDVDRGTGALCKAMDEW